MNSEEQNKAIEKIKSGVNVFLSGAGGVGKTYTAKQAVGQNTVVCAPTGIAALNVGGMTCHRAFGLPLGVPTEHDYLTVNSKVAQLFAPFSPVTTIMIDEIGCLRADQIALIDAKLRVARKRDEPFGGLQVVGLGDFLQMSPVLTQYEYEPYYGQFDSLYAFSTPQWNFETVELTKPFRNTDKRQVALLNSIRTKDKYYKKALEAITRESKPYEDSPNVTHLCCYKKDAAKHNKKYYSKLSTPEFVYKASITGNDKWNDATVPHEVKLKVGAKVIFKANDFDGCYVNGEKGSIVFLDSYNIVVRKESGQEVKVYRNKWDKYEYKQGANDLEKEIVSSFEQYPLDLAYGQSIHSSQGLTLDDVVVDIGKGCFSAGQFYVALSRVRNLKNLSFTRPVHYSNVICAKEVKQFYRGEL